MVLSITNSLPALSIMPTSPLRNQPSLSKDSLVFSASCSDEYQQGIMNQRMEKPCSTRRRRNRLCSRFHLEAVGRCGSISWPGRLSIGFLRLVPDGCHLPEHHNSRWLTGLPTVLEQSVSSNRVMAPDWTHKPKVMCVNLCLQ